MEEFVATAWSGGRTCELKISAVNRDRYLKREWGRVDLLIPNEPEPIPVNIDKASMWDGSCRELIHYKIRDWFRKSGKFPWPKGKPPRVRLAQSGPRAFALSFV
jgi:hypothetical protein